METKDVSPLPATTTAAAAAAAAAGPFFYGAAAAPAPAAAAVRAAGGPGFVACRVHARRHAALVRPDVWEGARGAAPPLRAHAVRGATAVRRGRGRGGRTGGQCAGHGRTDAQEARAAAQVRARREHGSGAGPHLLRLSRRRRGSRTAAARRVLHQQPPVRPQRQAPRPAPRLRQEEAVRSPGYMFFSRTKALRTCFLARVLSHQCCARFFARAGSWGIAFTPHILAVKAGEVRFTDLGSTFKRFAASLRLLVVNGVDLRVRASPLSAHVMWWLLATRPSHRCLL